MLDVTCLQSTQRYNALPSRQPPQQQQGVALMMVLLLVVSITIVAGSMLASQNISTRKSGLLFEQDRSLHHLNTGQQMAVELIRADAKVNDFDSWQDIWAEQIPAQQTADGYIIKLAINDASSRFNINNLYHDGAVDEQALVSFQRLLESLGLDTQLAVVILDWQDPDKVVYQDGGEEATVYKSAGHTSTVANQPFVSIDQLANLPEVTAETIATLRPYITAVPYWLPVNINTADELVLRSIVTKDKEQSLESLLNERDNKPISSKEALLALNLFGSASTGSTNSKNNNDNNSTKTTDSDTNGSEATKGKEQAKDAEQQNNEKQKNDEEQQKQAEKEALLAVNSRAFEVLVSVEADSQHNSQHGSKNNLKSRFATMMIAKGAVASSNVNSLDSTHINTETNKTDNTEEAEVQAFFQRMWAFQPPFPPEHKK